MYQKIYIRKIADNSFVGSFFILKSVIDSKDLNQFIGHILANFLIYVLENNKPITWYTNLQDNICNFAFEFLNETMEPEEIDLSSFYNIPIEKAKEFKFRRKQNKMAVRKKIKVLKRELIAI